ncbi:hypothetical protein [Acinetobacter lactucae]|uniref:hypothetical protein n=1 Tax=Acinetobacter lactucae TaxID=1785128 RepID=UPI0004F53517|nr:hypothetical protein [Acinetobacter lactucae]
MKAEQFIKDHGLERAREVVEGCPQYYHYYHIIEGVYYTCPKQNRVAVKDLKRLVESVDLVQHMGGIEALKGLINMINSPFALNGITRDGVFYSDEQIKELVKVHESIYGEGNE